MSSYWSKRRKVVSNVQEHVDAISNAISLAGNFELSSSPTRPESSPHVQDDISICSSMSNVSSDTLSETIDDFLDNQSQQPEVAGTISFDEFLEGRSEDEMSDSEDSDDATVNLSTLLVSWVTTFNITPALLNALLFILRKYHTYLPKGARTLLKTAKNYNILNIAGGCYYHFGIEKWVKTMIFTDNVEEVSIQVNIDGLPLFKSSGAQFWPILGKLVKPHISKPFLIGLFSGESKPSNLSEYLEHFVTELDNLFRNGILISETADDRVVFSLSCVICDAPAKAYIKQIKGHSGYSGCDQCSQNGYWNNKMTFPETNATLRTDVSFAERQDEEHHVGRTQFSDLPVGMVSQFPPDPMHLVYLGVVKRMIGLWMKGPVANASRIGSNAVKGISDNLVQLRGYLPREFNRKARTLHHVERWKATEFRQFLLYTGPVVLKKHLSPAKYRHFMLLFVSIFCLSCDLFCESYRDYVQELLCKFVQKFGELYGTDMLVFNVHGLVHLAKATEKFGTLDNFSAFVFESFLGNLKRLVRKPSLPLQQVIRRISESKGNLFDPTVLIDSSKDGKLKKKHMNGPVPRTILPLVASQYKAIQFPNLYFSTSKGDNCCLVNDDVVIIRNIITLNEHPDPHFVFEKFSRASDFFHLPLTSSDLRIKQVSHLSGALHVVDVSEIVCKCVLLPMDDDFVCLPLVHNFGKTH